MTRQYEISHPWIKFELHLEQANYKFWMLIGECKSKIDHIANVPLNPDLSTKMHLVYLAKGVHATTAIEGNTLSEAQVQLAIDGVLNSPPSQEYLKREVTNVIRACNRIGDRVLGAQDIKLTPRMLKYFNREVRHRLPKKPDCNCRAGQISEHPVVVGNVYRGAPREDCDYLLGTLCDWLNGPRLETKELDPIVLAIIKAMIAHLYVAWIHPFCDGNGRTARLVELSILLNAGIPTPIAHLLSNHYNATRTEYYAKLAITSISGGDVMPFLYYAVEGLRDQLAEQIEWIREQQMEAAWLRLIGEAFPSPPQTKHKRQRGLVEALGKDPVLLRKLTSVSPAVARDYALRSPSTLSRDVSDLVKLNLLEFDEAKATVRAKRETILAFLPYRKKKQQTEIDQIQPPKPKKRGRPKSIHTIK